MENYKFAIIYGNDDSKRNIEVGKIEKYGDLRIGDLNHIDYLIEYIDSKYSDIDMFKVLNNRHAPEIAAYLISRLGSVVFLNATKDAKKYGKTGFFMMPDAITEEQKESMYAFCSEIKDFNVSIYYNLKIVDGFLDGANLFPMAREEPQKLLDSFFNKVKEELEEIKSK